MGQLIEGKWVKGWYQADKKGRFVRKPTTFHQWIRRDGSSDFLPEENRYHLYVSYACPWAHRTLIMRKLKGLEKIISLSVVDFLMGEEGWYFSDRDGSMPDSVNHCQLLREVYLKADIKYSGRVSVPVLWDKKKGTIVNNESLEIMRMMDCEFIDLSNHEGSFYPEKIRDKIDQTIENNYHKVNNGVYRAGFAISQGAYDEAVGELFNTLDEWENTLKNQRYLCGNQLTEADWCFFTTLIRFDLVYAIHFKCSKRRIGDYPNLWNYLRELYQIPGVMETCNFRHIRNHYYQSHDSINPYRIVPMAQELDFNAPHNRNSI